jgi:hypothetical protein
MGVGPPRTERWESPSSIAAIIAGLVAAADIARQKPIRQRSSLGIDGQLVAFEPRQSDVHDQWILGRSSLL